MMRRITRGRPLLIALMAVLLAGFTMLAYGEVIQVTLEGMLYSYDQDGTRPVDNLHGMFRAADGTPVYCGEHGLDTPMGTQIGDTVSLDAQPYDSTVVRKILYYGYGGPGQWAGFYDSTYYAPYVKNGNPTRDCGIAVTSMALTESYGGYGRAYSVSGLTAFKAYIASMPDPAGFTVYRMASGNRTTQDLFTWKYQPNGSLRLIKSTARGTELTDLYPKLYSLAGATYTVYNPEGKPVGTLVTSAAGTTEIIALPAGTYFLQETAAPAGFQLDPTRHPVTIVAGEETTVGVTEEPRYGNVSLLLQKTQVDWSNEALPLEGAQYTVCYYPVLTDDVTGLEPERTWIFATDAEGKILLEEAYQTAGDALYTDEKGVPVLLLGTYTFEETYAPDGYERSEEILLRQVTAGDGLGGIQYQAPTWEEVPLPKLQTVATFQEGTKNGMPGEAVVVVDQVSYEDVSPGHSYLLCGNLVDPETGDVVASGETAFVPNAPSGVAQVTFSLNATPYGGKRLVVTEALYRTDRATEQLVAQHQDMTDAGQTVRFPAIQTTATGKDGEKVLYDQGPLEIVDQVTYQALTPGKAYTIYGTLMDAKTGAPLMDADGQEIQAEKTFVPESTEGSISLTFTLDGSQWGGHQVVAFEELYEDGILIGMHADLTDAGQTVTIERTPPIPNTGGPSTGDLQSTVGPWIGLGLGVLVTTLALALRKRA